MFYHNFTDFNVKNKNNYKEIESFTTSSVISGSYLFDPAYQTNIEMKFIFDDFFNRHMIFKFKLWPLYSKFQNFVGLKTLFRSEVHPHQIWWHNSKYPLFVITLGKVPIPISFNTTPCTKILWNRVNIKIFNLTVHASLESLILCYMLLLY